MRPNGDGRSGCAAEKQKDTFIDPPSLFGWWVIKCVGMSGRALSLPSIHNAPKQNVVGQVNESVFLTDGVAKVKCNLWPKANFVDAQPLKCRVEFVDENIDEAILRQIDSIFQRREVAAFH